MDIEKLIEQLNDWNEKYISNLCGDRTIKCEEYCIKDDCLIVKAATALSTLQAENEKLRAELKTCKEKNAGLALALLTECAPNPDCLGDDEWRAIRVELERVKAERDAAVEDVAAIIGDVEEIRRGYDVGNADADGAFAVLCETYCTNKGRSCYAECEKYHCKNFKWRGRKED